MSISNLQLYVQASLDRYLQHEQPHGSSAEPELEDVEYIYRLGDQCPVDIVAGAVVQWLLPVAKVLGNMLLSPELLDPLVAIILRVAGASHRMRSRAAATEKEARLLAIDARLLEEHKAALELEQSRCSALEQELKSTQLAYLEACEAILIKSAVQQRSLEDRDALVAQLRDSLSAAEQTVLQITDECDKLKQRLTSEYIQRNEFVFHETSCTSALRLAWGAAEAETRSIRAHCTSSKLLWGTWEKCLRLQLVEQEERIRLALEFASSAFQCITLEPFRKAVAAVTRLRSTLISLRTPSRQFFLEHPTYLSRMIVLVATARLSHHEVTPCWMECL